MVLKQIWYISLDAEFSGEYHIQNPLWGKSYGHLKFYANIVQKALISEKLNFMFLIIT